MSMHTQSIIEVPTVSRSAGRLHSAMARYVAGEDAAFTTLYGALAPRIRQRLTRLVRDAALVEDLLQLTFLRAHVARARFESLPAAADRAVEGWYLSIARNVALDHLREHYRRERRHAGMAARGDVAAIGLPDADPTMEEMGLDRERSELAAEQIYQALDQLPSGQREVVKLHKIDGLSMAEVADRLHVRQGAVRVRAHRAYKALAEILHAPAMQAA
jgi:RNA polymerase sigma-70 factor, ECF subfamily